MGNHCIEVTCADCGRNWCVRGCTFDTGPDADRARRVQDELAANPKLIKAGDPCTCGSSNSYMGSFYPK
jgi:hypothetical protein